MKKGFGRSYGYEPIEDKKEPEYSKEFIEELKKRKKRMDEGEYLTEEEFFSEEKD